MDLARRTVNVSFAHEKKIYGEGIGVAIIDTGICSHPDFTQGGNRIVCFKDFVHLRTRLYDDYGHGTHVAGIIGGNGFASGGRYRGIAPKCSLIVLKALNYKGDGNIAEVIEALEWVLAHQKEFNIRVINLSFGTGSKKVNEEGQKLIDTVERVWDSGIVVVAAAGNGGPNPSTIAIPGSSKKVITVGASDDSVEVDLMGSRQKNYSGRGPTLECIKKPDIVAPASNIMSCNLVRSVGNESIRGVAQGKRGFIYSNIRERYNQLYTEKSGTSMSTPIVTGAVAVLLSAQPSLTPKDVKIKLKDSAFDLGFPQSRQGWGLLDIKKLLS